MPKKNPNPTTYLVLVFLFLLVLTVVLKFNPLKKEIPPSLLLTGFDSAQVSKISIKPGGSDQVIVLEKSQNDWIMLPPDEEATKAAQEQVTAFLDILAELDKNDLVSQNKDKYNDFIIDDKNASQIEVWQNANSNTLWVGKSTSDFMGNYIRVQNDDFVYKSSVPLNNYLSSSAFR